MTKTVKSESAARTKSNEVLHRYRDLSDKEKRDVSDIKNLSQVLMNKVEELGDSDATHQAKVKIQEAVFWAVSHVTA